MTSQTIKHFNPTEVSLTESPNVWLQKVFVYFLSSFFSHEEFRGTGMHWSRNEDSSELIITGQKPRVEALNKRPHIVVIPGPFSWGNLSFDQLQARNSITGTKTHTDLVSQTIGYHCQAKEGNLASSLAWFASFYTIVFRNMIQRQGQLHYVKPSPTTTSESGPTAFTGPLVTEELVSVVVNFPIFWQPKWKITPPAPIARQIGFTLGMRQPTVPTNFGGKAIYRSIPIEDYAERPVSLNQTVNVDLESKPESE